MFNGKNLLFLWPCSTINLPQGTSEISGSYRASSPTKDTVFSLHELPGGSLTRCKSRRPTGRSWSCRVTQPPSPWRVAGVVFFLDSRDEVQMDQEIYIYIYCAKKALYQLYYYILFVHVCIYLCIYIYIYIYHQLFLGCRFASP